MNTVFVFNSYNSKYPSAVFSTKDKAISWVENNQLSGIITEMPMDISTYDHAIENDLFTPKKPHEMTSGFIGKFSSRLWHGHFGKPPNITE